MLCVTRIAKTLLSSIISPMLVFSESQYLPSSSITCFFTLLIVFDCLMSRSSMFLRLYPSSEIRLFYSSLIFY